MLRHPSGVVDQVASLRTNVLRSAKKPMTRGSNRSELNRKNTNECSLVLAQFHAACRPRYVGSTKFIDRSGHGSKLNVVHAPLTIGDGELKL
jgi:hypothetical protein